MASKTNTGLVSYAKAQVGLPYWYGTYGQTSSKSLYDSKKKQYPNQYTASDFSSQYNKRVHDCVGLIKGYLWSDSNTATPKYNSSQDKSANGMYTAASTKGKISTIEDIAGILVFKGSSTSNITHVGVYGGDGYVYEAKGHAYGVVKTKYSKNDWQYWAECPYLTYSKSSSSSSSSSSTKTTTTTTTSTATSTGSTSTEKTMYVNTNSKNLNVRKKASSTSTIVTSLAKGTKVTVVGTSGNWSQIKSPAGYVSTKYLSSTKPSTSSSSNSSSSTKTTTTTTTTSSSSSTSSSTVYYKVTTSTKNLNCRKTAALTGTIVGSFAKGTKVEYKNKQSGKWLYVSGKSTTGKTITGYCKSTYLTKC